MFDCEFEGEFAGFAGGEFECPFQFPLGVGAGVAGGGSLDFYGNLVVPRDGHLVADGEFYGAGFVVGEGGQVLVGRAGALGHEADLFGEAADLFMGDGEPFVSTECEVKGFVGAGVGEAAGGDEDAVDEDIHLSGKQRVLAGVAHGGVEEGSGAELGRRAVGEFGVEA